VELQWGLEEIGEVDGGCGCGFVGWEWGKIFTDCERRKFWGLGAGFHCLKNFKECLRRTRVGDLLMEGHSGGVNFLPDCRTEFAHRHNITLYLEVLGDFIPCCNLKGR
jgi:hypothetical protein